MNLSKTAKRFLSSTMAIALAGGSVLAFGNSALADDLQDTSEADAVLTFTGSVSPECSLVTLPSTLTDNYTATSGYSITDYDTTANDDTGATETRVTQLSSTATVKFDCNTESVNLTFPVATDTPPTISGTPASNLGASHSFEYTANSGTAQTLTQTSTAIPTDTDVDGDLELGITSTFTAATNKELLAGSYSAQVEVQVVAQ